MFHVFEGWDLLIAALAVIGADRVIQWLLHLEIPSRRRRW